MSKIRTEDVFKLIKSMSASEKRHFNLFSSRHIASEKNKSLKLFDLLEAQEEFDEAAILKNKSFSDRKKFFDLRGQLYKRILQALDYFHYEETAEKKIKNRISYIGILIDRGLYPQAEHQLEKAKELAEKYEKNILLLELTECELTLMRMAGNVKKMDKRLEELEKENSKNSERHNNYFHYYSLITLHYWQSAKKSLDIKPGNTIKARIYRDPLLKNEKKALSFKARFLYHFIHFSKGVGIKKYNTAYLHGKKQHELVSKYSELADEVPHTYRIQALLNRSISEIELKLYSEAKNTLLAAYDVKIKNNYQRVRWFYTMLTLELHMYINSIQLEKGIERILEVEKEINEIPLRFGNRYTELLLLWRTASLCFFSGKYSDANRYLNSIINDTQQLRPDIVMLASLMRLLAQKELGNEDYVEYEAKSLIHIVRTQKSKLGMMGAIIEFVLIQLPKLTDKRSMQNMLEELKKKISNIPKDHSDILSWDEFPVIAWLESKMENKPIAEIIRRNLKI